MMLDLSVYLVTDSAACRSAGRTVTATVAEAVAGGVTCVQVREKHASARDVLQLLTALGELLPEPVALFVNDRIDVFAAARARGVRVTGVHVGQSDLPVSAVRALVGPDALIGLSASTPTQLEAAAADPAGVAYVGIGALHPTTTKPDAPEPLGHEGFARLCAVSPLPAVAIGGVTAADLPRLRAAGAAGGAVSSAVCAAPVARSAAARLAAAWRGEEAEPPGTEPRRADARSAARPTALRPPARRPPRVLAIAGTDPTGGAGLQADLKAIAANGGYGMAVTTALVAQNTRGVRSVHVPPVGFVREQLDAVSDDVTIDAVKIGMLASAEIAAAVDSWLAAVRPPLVVLDPVMVSTSGDRLLDRDAVDALRALAARADLVTPNLPELAILAGEPVADDWEAALAQAQRVSRALGVRVLAKGGHLDRADAPDALVDARAAREPSIRTFASPRVDTRNTHGTGCSLSSALATRLAGAEVWDRPIAEVKGWLTRSLAAADDLDVGSGNGPINHFSDLWHGGRPSRAAWQAAAGSEDWWAGVADVRDRIHASPFVRGIVDGTLDRAAYRRYLAQDALYLASYADLLDRASALSPSPAEAAFWAASARECREEELRLHRDELGGARARPAPVTSAYVGHLRAAASAGHAVLVAALLPCFELYADIGAANADAPVGHPFHEWLATYSSESFLRNTERAADHARAARAGADEPTRLAAWDAYRASSELEDAFFREAWAPEVAGRP